MDQVKFEEMEANAKIQVPIEELSADEVTYIFGGRTCNAPTGGRWPIATGLKPWMGAASGACR
jgi:hypothetical protein